MLGIGVPAHLGRGDELQGLFRLCELTLIKLVAFLVSSFNAGEATKALFFIANRLAFGSEARAEIAHRLAGALKGLSLANLSRRIRVELAEFACP
jgi:hypothetical protein